MSKTSRGVLTITLLAIVNGVGVLILGETMAFLSGVLISVAFILGENNAK
jgi:hypothetical protein